MCRIFRTASYTTFSPNVPCTMLFNICLFYQCFVFKNINLGGETYFHLNKHKYNNVILFLPFLIFKKCLPYIKNIEFAPFQDTRIFRIMHVCMPVTPS